jgi:hypothetical protein
MKKLLARVLAVLLLVPALVAIAPVPAQAQIDLNQINDYVYTVGLSGSGADYEVHGTADDEINAALTDCSANADCSEVRQLEGEFEVADIIQVPSNVTWRGAGIDKTIIKAEDDYAPASQADCPQTGRCVVVAKDATALAHVTNVTISSITFDGNGPGRDCGYSPGGSAMVLDIRNVTNFRLENSKVFNGLNYDVFIVNSNNVWVEHNTVLNGWSAAGACPGGLDQQDGIHLRGVQNFFITNNRVDTSDANNGGVSGDDAIVFGSGASQSNQDTAYGVVSGNNISSGTNGIVILQEGSYNTRDITVTNNPINGTNLNGIAFRYYGSANYGQYQNVTVANNPITNWGLDTGHVSSAIRASFETGSPVLAFSNVVITNNPMRTSSAVSGNSYISWLLKGNGLTISSNDGVGLLGTPGIQVGNTSTPVKDLVLTGNKVDMSATGISNPIGIFLFGTERSVVAANEIFGATTGTGRGIYISGAATAGNDASGVPKIETIQYNNVYGNLIHNVDNGIEEAATFPDNDSFATNHFSSVTTNYTLTGASSKVFGDNGATFVVNKTFTPFANDGAALGTTSLSWSDAFFASGAVINFNAGDVLLTHSSNLLALTGGNLAVGGSSAAQTLSVFDTSADSTTPLSVNAGSAADSNAKTVKIRLSGQSSGFSSQADIISGHEGLGTAKATYLSFAVRNTAAGTVDEVLRLSSTGHLISGGVAPAASSCGATPSVTSTSTDTAGKVTIGTGTTTSCTMTFATTYATAPACTVSGDNTAVTYIATTSASVLTITSSADMASDVLSYICIGHT